MKTIISIIGARPQFIKHAPVQLELQKHFNAKTIHTGQHYDQKMSAVFFDDLGIPKPDYLLDINGVQHQGAQTGLMMKGIEDVLLSERPDAILVYGDTNSTLAGTLVAAKMNIPIIHIEAGLRSYNRSMPEEVNRIIADEFSKLLFCPTEQAIENLKKEGIDHPYVFLTGDVMCDMLLLMLPKAIKLKDYPYYFATIHRPYNTDDPERLLNILKALQEMDRKVVFAIHPRTLNRLSGYGYTLSEFDNIEFIEPVGYVDSISYQAYADAVITDSGGIQKEAYILKKKCITLRSETEWVETLKGGWNQLLFENVFEISSHVRLEPSNYQEGLYGNGTAAAEIVDIINKNL